MTHQNSQEAVMAGGKLAARCEASQGVRTCTNERETCVCVCETYPHIWNHLCWIRSLVDRCRRSYQRCWCTLLHHTHRRWCCIRRCLKHTHGYIINTSSHHGTHLSSAPHASSDLVLKVQHFFVWKDAVARCSKKFIALEEQFLPEVK